MLRGIRAQLADRLFEIGAIKFASRPGEFRLKLHETHPDAPLSPIFFNLRTPDNPKPGPLTPEVLRLIGRALAEIVASRVGGFDHITPIPNAGDPIAYALRDALADGRGLLLLQKVEAEGKRRIAAVKPGQHYAERDRTLLVDDLITQADTKLEAIEALHRAYLIVEDLVLLIDRQQGGREYVEARGVKVHALFTMRELLEYYLATGRISLPKADEVLVYIDANRV